MPSLVFSYRKSSFQLKSKIVNESFVNLPSFPATIFYAFALLTEEIIEMWFLTDLPQWQIAFSVEEQREISLNIEQEKF